MVSSASNAPCRYGLSFTKASCVAASLRLAGHRNRASTISRTFNSAFLTSESGQGTRFDKSTPFGGPAASYVGRSLGFAPPPRGEFAFSWMSYLWYQAQDRWRGNGAPVGIMFLTHRLTRLVVVVYIR
jgi:hypothetical protein